jgi:hypothetical protein
VGDVRLKATATATDSLRFHLRLLAYAACAYVLRANALRTPHCTAHPFPRQDFDFDVRCSPTRRKYVIRRADARPAPYERSVLASVEVRSAATVLADGIRKLNQHSNDCPPKRPRGCKARGTHPGRRSNIDARRPETGTKNSRQWIPGWLSGRRGSSPIPIPQKGDDLVRDCPGHSPRGCPQGSRIDPERLRLCSYCAAKAGLEPSRRVHSRRVTRNQMRMTQ